MRHWQIRRYEGCLLSALDSRGNGQTIQATPALIAKWPGWPGCGEANHSHAHVPAATAAAKPSAAGPAEALREGGSNKASRQCTEASSSRDGEVASASASVVGDEGGEQWLTSSSRPPSTTSTFFSEQAKLLSDLFSHPRKLADCPVKEDHSTGSFRHQMGPKLVPDWR